MLNVNDFKLVLLSELVHDEALLKSYLGFIEAIDEVYAIEDLEFSGEIDLGADYMFEGRLLDKECLFWRGGNKEKTPQNFLRWVNSVEGYWSRYEDDTPDTFKLCADVLISVANRNVLGRSNLFAGLQGGKWLGSGFDCIHPDFRDLGLGRVILAHRLNQAREIGVDEMKLNVNCLNMGSAKRLEKLEAAGLSLRTRFSGRAKHKRQITWITLPNTLEAAYKILTTNSSNSGNHVGCEL